MAFLPHRSSAVMGLFALGVLGGCVEEGSKETAEPSEKELGSCAKCTVVTANVFFDRLGGLVTDGTTVRWFDTQAGDHLWSVGTDGANLRGVETCRGNHRLPKIYDQFVYFDTCGGGSCGVYRVPLDAVAKTCEPVLPSVDGTRNEFFIDASTNTLYAQRNGLVPVLQRVDLATLQPTALPNVSWSFEASYADHRGIYGNINPSGASATNTIVQLDRATFQSTNLATEVSGPNATGLPPQVLFTDASDVYFYSDGGLYRVARAGGSAVRIAGPDSAWELRLDGTDVVWYQLSKPNIYRMPIKGGPVTTISTGSFAVRGLTFDSKRYYFMETSSKLGYEQSQTWTLRAVAKTKP